MYDVDFMGDCNWANNKSLHLPEKLENKIKSNIAIFDENETYEYIGYIDLEFFSYSCNVVIISVPTSSIVCKVLKELHTITASNNDNGEYLLENNYGISFDSDDNNYTISDIINIHASWNVNELSRVFVIEIGEMIEIG